MSIRSSRKKDECCQKTIAIWLFLLCHLCAVYMAYSLEKDPASVFPHFRMMGKTCLNPMLILLRKA